jgi:Zn finger protein HypA/HybF involved in hydrogenase expression
VEKHQSNTQQQLRTSSKRERRALYINGVKVLMGDKCHDCGYDRHWEILQFHHVIPRQISGRPPMQVVKDWSWERCRDELLEHTVLLCPTCHSERHLLDEHDSIKYTYEIDI